MSVLSHLKVPDWSHNLGKHSAGNASLRWTTQALSHPNKKQVIVHILARHKPTSEWSSGLNVMAESQSLALDCGMMEYLARIEGENYAGSVYESERRIQC